RRTNPRRSGARCARHAQGTAPRDAFGEDALRLPMARVRRVTVSGRRSFEYVSQGKGPATLLVHPGGPGATYHYLRGLLRRRVRRARVRAPLREEPRLSPPLRDRGKRRGTPRV